MFTARDAIQKMNARTPTEADKVLHKHSDSKLDQTNMNFNCIVEISIQSDLPAPRTRAFGCSRYRYLMLMQQIWQASE